MEFDGVVSMEFTWNFLWNSMEFDVQILYGNRWRTFPRILWNFSSNYMEKEVLIVHEIQ